MSSQQAAWILLESPAIASAPIIELFDNSKSRVNDMSFEVAELYADFSKQRICPEILEAMMDLACAHHVDTARQELFAGAPINRSENRAVLHPALRGVGGDTEIQKLVAEMCHKTRAFAEKIRSDGKIKTIVHIGIGGSDLGPRLIADAFSALKTDKLDLRFAENVDGASINDAIDGLDPKTTLVVAVSKTFSTQETIMNASARA